VSTDNAQTPADDTPVAAHQHAWKRAARDDPRMTARHLAVVDAYAEHFYSGKASMRGVGLSVERITYWTRLRSTAIRGARADLVRWGWLGTIKRRGRGTVARYALTSPSSSSSSEPLSTETRVIPKEAASRPSKSSSSTVKEAASRPSKPDRRPPRGPLPLPSNPLPASRAPERDDGRPVAGLDPRRGRQGSPPDKPKPPGASQADANTVALVVPRGLLQTARGARTAPVLGRALAEATAAGWSVEQIRAELAGIETARQPLGAAVARLRDLAGRPAPAPVVAGPGSDRLDTDALDAGRICGHGNPDRRTAAGLHRCPICRRQEAAMTTGEAAAQ
jgi:hypothetical protein